MSEEGTRSDSLHLKSLVIELSPWPEWPVETAKIFVLALFD